MSRDAVPPGRDADERDDPEPPSWPPVGPGVALTVVKLSPDGLEAARYRGVVMAAKAPAPWLAVSARWLNPRVDLDGLAFVTGDTLREYFSPADRFNAFAVFAPDGRLRGWYANVTHPTRLDLTTDPPTLTWHDLYLDVVALPDGTVTVRDEDELEAAAVAAHEPALHATILAARDEILRRVARRAFPFHELPGRRGERSAS